MKRIGFLLLVVFFLHHDIAEAVVGPPSLEEIVKRSDKIALFRVLDVEYIKKKMTFTDSRRDETDMERPYTYTTNMLLTKYSIEVVEQIKKTMSNEVYEVYSDGGINDDGMILKSSVGFDLEVGDEVIIMLEFDDVNNVYLSTLHNSTVFREISVDGETKLVAYSGMQYYKYADEVTSLLSVPNGFKSNYENDIYISDIMEFINE